MYVLQLAALIATLCQPYQDTDKCEKYMNDCFEKEMQRPYIKQFKAEYGRANAFLFCVNKGGYNKKLR